MYSAFSTEEGETTEVNKNEMKEDCIKLVKTARVAGIWYLLMAVFGILGFMVLHSQVYSADARETLTHLTEETHLARLRLLAEFMIIIFQALTAVWFYRLFRKTNEWAAWATGVWGMVNAVIIMVSSVGMAVAIKTAASDQPVEGKLLLIDLLTNLINSSWSIGGLFFGLWLMPLGYVITSSKRMPAWLGRTLIIGGIGYLLSTFLKYYGISGSWVRALTLPATIGEFWMIGYLLIFGIRPEGFPQEKSK